MTINMNTSSFAINFSFLFSTEEYAKTKNNTEHTPRRKLIYIVRNERLISPSKINNQNFLYIFFKHKIQTCNPLCQSKIS